MADDKRDEIDLEKLINQELDEGALTDSKDTSSEKATGKKYSNPVELSFDDLAGDFDEILSSGPNTDRPVSAEGADFTEDLFKDFSEENIEGPSASPETKAESEEANPQAGEVSPDEAVLLIKASSEADIAEAGEEKQTASEDEASAEAVGPDSVQAKTGPPPSEEPAAAAEAAPEKSAGEAGAGAESPPSEEPAAAAETAPEKAAAEAESKSEEKEVRQDDEDILAELGLGEEKAELDVEDLAETVVDKAVLDTEGILDEGEPIVEESNEPSPEPAVAEQGTEPSDELQGAGIFQRIRSRLDVGTLIGRLRGLPWVKISAVSGGTFVIFLTAWLGISYFFSPVKPSGVLENEFIESPEALPETEPLSEFKGVTQFELKTFFIPLEDPRRETTFLRLNLLLSLREITEEQLKKEEKSIRLDIYNVLTNKNLQDFKNLSRQKTVITELKNLLNNRFKKNAVMNIIIKEMVLA